MKYLKLFESYQETTDSLNNLRDEFEEKSNIVINEYKKLIDDLLLDISDDYLCEFVSKYDYHRKINKEDDLIRYRIVFPIGKIDDFFEKLEDVLDRMISNGIFYTIDSIKNYEMGHISSKPAIERHPFCIGTSKTEALKYKDRGGRLDICLYISF
jgi:hypothetical protein